MSQDFIKMKGAVDGVKIYVLNNADIMDIIINLNEKLDEWRNFFSGAICNIYIIGREFSSSDKVRIETIINTHLPLCNVIYGEPAYMSKHAVNKAIKSSNDKIERGLHDFNEKLSYETDAVTNDNSHDNKDSHKLSEFSELDKIILKWDEERQFVRKHADMVVRKWDKEYKKTMKMTINCNFVIIAFFKQLKGCIYLHIPNL